MSNVVSTTTQVVEEAAHAQIQIPPPAVGGLSRDDHGGTRAYPSVISSSFATDRDGVTPAILTIDETQELSSFERAAILLHFRLCNFARRIFLLTPILLVFFVAIASAILNWRRHENESRSTKWIATRGEVVGMGTSNDSSLLGVSDRAFRAEVQIRNYGLDDPNEIVTAFFGRNPQYNLTEAAAKAQLDSLTINAGRLIWELNLVARQHCSHASVQALSDVHCYPPRPYLKKNKKIDCSFFGYRPPVLLATQIACHGAT